MNQSELIMVTGNEAKAREVGEILGMPVTARKVPLTEIQALDVRDVGRAKAREAFEKIGQAVIVDDTSLSIEALNGLPGALVSWFLDQLGPQGIVDLIKDKADRRATVATCIAYCDGDEVRTFLGEVQGVIPEVPRGSEGFGYDPIFQPEGQEKTYAEMSSDEKNSLSMRKRALDKLAIFLSQDHQAASGKGVG